MLTPPFIPPGHSSDPLFASLRGMWMPFRSGGAGYRRAANQSWVTSVSPPRAMGGLREAAALRWHHDSLPGGRVRAAAEVGLKCRSGHSRKLRRTRRRAKLDGCDPFLYTLDQPRALWRAEITSSPPYSACRAGTASTSRPNAHRHSASRWCKNRTLRIRLHHRRPARGASGLVEPPV